MVRIEIRISRFLATSRRFLAPKTSPLVKNRTSTLLKTLHLETQGTNDAPSLPLLAVTKQGLFPLAQPLPVCSA